MEPSVGVDLERCTGRGGRRISDDTDNRDRISRIAGDWAWTWDAMAHYSARDGVVGKLTFPKLPFPIAVISSKSSMLKGPYTIQ